jgi:inner membrane protein
MTGRSHLLLTAAVYLALGLHPATTPIGIAAPRLSGGPLDVPMAGLITGAAIAAAAGLAPDADRSGSTAARAGGLPTRAAAWLVQRALGHRGPLHSLAALALAWWAGWAFGPAIGVDGLGPVVAFGWGMHLLIDALTPRGVSLLWPLPLRVRIPPGLPTGGMGENLAVLLAVLACGWWIGVK